MKKLPEEMDFFRCFIALALVLSLASCRADKHLDTALPQSTIADLHSGDLIFLDLDCGELCNAIDTVTKEQFQVSGPNLSHIGIVEIDKNGQSLVIEAWPEGGVKETRIEKFLSRVHGKGNEPHGFYIERFKEKYRPLALAAVMRARRLIGHPYNNVFTLNRKSYYCSQLVYDSYLVGGTHMFSLTPMFYGKPNEDSYRVWKKYFDDLKLNVPEGKPGISPLGIYLQGRKYFLSSAAN